MNWIRNIFGSPDTAKKIVDTAADGIYNGLDKMVYTKEESVDDRKELVSKFSDFVIKTFDNNDIRNVTRRWLAWTVTGFVLLNAQLCIILVLLGKKSIAKEIINVVNAFEIGIAFVAVLTAYFGVQWLRR